MVHVGGGMNPSVGSGLPKSPSFHQGLAYAAVLPHDMNNKQRQPISALQYQPLQSLLLGKIQLTNSSFYFFHLIISLFSLIIIID